MNTASKFDLCANSSSRSVANATKSPLLHLEWQTAILNERNEDTKPGNPRRAIFCSSLLRSFFFILISRTKKTCSWIVTLHRIPRRKWRMQRTEKSSSHLSFAQNNLECTPRHSNLMKFIYSRRENIFST